LLQQVLGSQAQGSPLPAQGGALPPLSTTPSLQPAATAGMPLQQQQRQPDLCPGTAELEGAPVLVSLLVNPPPALQGRATTLKQAAVAIVRASEAAGSDGRRALVALLPAFGKMFEHPHKVRRLYGDLGPPHSVDVDHESGFWTVCHVIYSAMAEACGMRALRAAHRQWPQLEKTFTLRFGWEPSMMPSSSPPDAQRKAWSSYSRGPSKELQELLLEDVGWSVPFQHQSQASKPHAEDSSRGAAAAEEGTGSQHPKPPGIISRTSASGNTDRSWRWLLQDGPDQQADTSQADTRQWLGFGGLTSLQMARGPPERQGANQPFWVRNWNLSLTPIHGWPAHRDKLRALTVNEGEWIVVTSGRGTVGGQAQEVCRAWGLADCQAGVQYRQHQAPVLELLMLPSASQEVVASLDTAGALHLWSALSGETLAVVADCRPAGLQRTAVRGPLAAAALPAATVAVASSRSIHPGSSGDHILAPPMAPDLSLSPPMLRVPIATANNVPWPLEVPPPSSSSAPPAGGHFSAPTSPSPLGIDVKPNVNSLSASHQPGFSCIAGGDGRAGGHCLLAGTPDGRVQLLDASRGNASCASAISLSVAPAGPASSSSTVTRLAPGPSPASVLAASASGTLSLLDTRSGAVVWRWRIHEGGEVTALTAAEGRLAVTAGHDGAVKLWDLRFASPAPRAGSCEMAGRPPGLLHKWQYSQPVGDLQTMAGQIICHSGHHVGVLQLQTPFGSSFQAVRRRQSSKGAVKECAIVGLGVLPHSQLLLVGSEDGSVRVCT